MYTVLSNLAPGGQQVKFKDMYIYAELLLLLHMSNVHTCVDRPLIK